MKSSVFENSSERRGPVKSPGRETDVGELGCSVVKCVVRSGIWNSRPRKPEEGPLTTTSLRSRVKILTPTETIERVPGRYENSSHLLSETPPYPSLECFH